MDGKNTERFSRNFQTLSLEYQLSNINQAKAFARYMQELDCFYTDRSVDFELVEKFSEDDLKKIGPLEHQRWLQEHYDMGWSYGEPDRAQRELIRQHKDMIPAGRAKPLRRSWPGRITTGWTRRSRIRTLSPWNVCWPCCACLTGCAFTVCMNRKENRYDK